MKITCRSCTTPFVVDELSDAPAFSCPSCGVTMNARVGAVAEAPATLRPIGSAPDGRPAARVGPPPTRPLARLPIGARPSPSVLPPMPVLDTRRTSGPPRRSCPACGAKLESTATRCGACGADYQRALRVSRGEPATDAPDVFRPEKALMRQGVVGGVALIGIAVTWFFVGLHFGYIYFYPPVLAVFGLVAILGGASPSPRRTSAQRRRRRP